MQRQIKLISFCCALSVAGLAGTAHAANMVSTSNVGGSTGWNSSNIWKTNGTGTAVTGVVAGNTYECRSNGVAFGNNTGNARMRNLYASTSPLLQVFPGDSLTLNTNTEFRFKRIDGNNVPTVSFPGVGGNPGFILNGGVLNVGDDMVLPVAGKIYAVPGTLSFICPGDNGAGPTARNSRTFNIVGDLSGSGTIMIFQSPGVNPQQISGNANTFSGQWIVKAGWLQGVGNNSLGTGNILLDPQATPPLDASVLSTLTLFAGPAILEPMYDVNTPGTLTVVNGGQVRLHQNCAFTAVTIEGTPLSPGRHPYSELAATFAATTNFPAGGYGTITVQPYGQLPVAFLQLPLPQMVYVGRTARFDASASGAGTLTYKWRKGGVDLTDGGNISGATTPNLVVSNVSAGDQANYDVTVSNGSDSVTSPAVSLTPITPSSEGYETAVLAANPAVYYRLNETANPAGSPFAFDYAGGGVGTYGTGTQNGYNSIAGPTPTDGFTGFAAGNKALFSANATVGSRVTVAPWNFNTNTITMTAWINPGAAGQAASEGLVFCRGGGTVAGLNYSSATDAAGNRTLGYTWNNEWDTYSWDSGIAPPAGQWSLVALVVTPNLATIYVLNTNGFTESAHPYTHVSQAFGGTTLIGDDSNAANGSRAFNGTIDDVAVFTAALSRTQLLGLYAAGLGTTPQYAPTVTLQPVSQFSMYPGQTATFRVAGGGSEPLTYQWKKGATGSGVYANMSDGGNISGTTSSILVISNISNADSMLDYVVTLTNPYGTTNSAAASLVVLPTSLAENITMAGVLQPGGADWDTGDSWSDFNAASLSAVMKPGSTYRLTPSGNVNTRMRTPESPRIAVFPGNLLTVDGTAVFNYNFGTNSTPGTAEIRFRQPTPGTVIFPKLVMNGGQLGLDRGTLVEIGGLLEIRTNTPVYNNASADRGILMSAQLTGSGTVEYRGYSINNTAFVPSYVNNLNIACPNNTFSGKWNVVSGTLLGTAPNCLGTNDIIIGASAAFEPTYDMNSTNGTLSLSGRMYLHQNHTFKSLFVNGAPLAVGTYYFTNLNATYPANFPASWTPQVGAANFTTGSGSITVLVQPAPQIVLQPIDVTKYPTETAQFTITAQGSLPLYYRWRKGGVALTDGGNLFGSTTNTLTITNIVSGNGGTYDIVVTNSIGSVTSSPAILTVLPTGPALNLALDYGGAPIIQASGLDWNSITNWSDGQSASISALSNPGSTYEVVPRARLRSPASAAYSAFPGDVLTVSGDGVWANDGTATIGEIRFKHSNPGTAYFKRLVMNGGQLDSGDDGVIVIAGWMDVMANTPIYVDNAAGHDRPYQIDAWMTGSGGIEFHQWGATFTAENLNITGTSNTFSGPWNIVQGCVLGSGPNSLGTNNINIGLTGALETLYDIYNPLGSLLIDFTGQVLLHQNDAFRAVTVAGTPLPVGVYTFDYLNTTYPANFPRTWTQQRGSTFSTGSGSITVLGDTLPPVSIYFTNSPSGLTLTWSQGQLLQAPEITGPWTTNTTAKSPFTVTPSDPRQFYRIQVR